MSVGVRPSSLGPPVKTLFRTVDFTKDLKASFIAFVLSISSSRNFWITSSCNSLCFSLLSDLSVKAVIESTLSEYSSVILVLSSSE